MALDYVTANTGVFYRIGELIKILNAHTTLPATTLPAELKAIADPFEAADLTPQINTLYDVFAGEQNNQVTLRQQLAGYADTVLSDPVNVLPFLNLTTADLAGDFFEALWAKMVTDTKTVDRSTVSLGSVTAGGSNVGNGTVILTKVLDGVTPPLSGVPSLFHYLGVDSELAVNETMIFEVTADSAGGATSGSESVRWAGGIQQVPFSYLTEGSGEGPTLTVAGTGGIITDGEFENFTVTDTPDSWTITAGAVTTNIAQETSTTYRSGSALKMLATGIAAITVTQDLTNVMTPGQSYMMTLYLKCSSAAPTNGDFTATITYTKADGSGSGTVSGAISVGHAALTTSFALKSALQQLPLRDMSAVTLTLSWSGTPTNTKNLFIDCVALTPVTYHGGIGAVVVPGSTDFVKGDRFTAAITNDQAGTFQEFFRRQYGVQLRSTGGGTENITDALATGGNVVTVTDGGTAPLVLTDRPHEQTTGAAITLAGVTGYTGAYATVTVVGPRTFLLDATVYGSDSTGGTWYPT